MLASGGVTEEILDWQSVLKVRKVVLSLDVCENCDSVFEETGTSSLPNIHLCARCR
jgi:hypothetical protein